MRLKSQERMLYTNRAASSSIPPPPPPMNFRKLAFLGLGGIVLTGSWYYRDSLAELTGLALSSTPPPSSAAGSAASTSTPEGVRIVAIDHGSLYTGLFAGQQSTVPCPSC